MTGPEPEDPSPQRRLLLLALLLSALTPLVVAIDHRTVRGHETATHHALQHFFLSGASVQASAPLWVFAVGQGVSSQDLFVAQGGILQLALLPAAPLLEGMAFTPLYALGILLETLAFALGCWRLGRRLYGCARAAFFVTTAAVASSVWADHLWLNFRAVCFLPLLVDLLYAWFETRSPAKALLAGGLLGMQLLSSPLYLWPLPFLVSAAWFAGAAFAFGWRPQGRPSLPAAAAAASGLAIPVGAVLAGSGGLASTGAAPAPGDALLGSGLGFPLETLDLAFGANAGLDATLYCGTSTLLFAYLAGRLMPRGRVLRLAGAVLVSLVLIGAALALLAAAIPRLRPPRPLPVGLPLARLGLVLLAGWAFARLWRRGAVAPSDLRRAARFALLVAAAAGVFAWGAAQDSELVAGLFEAMGAPIAEPARSPLPAHSALLSEFLAATALSGALAGAVYLAHAASPRLRPLALGLGLLLHPLDVFGWHFRTTWIKTVASRRLEHPPPPVQAAAFAPRRESRAEIRARGDRPAGGDPWSASLPAFPGYGASPYPGQGPLGDLSELLPPPLGCMKATADLHRTLPPGHPDREALSARTVDKIRFLRGDPGSTRRPVEVGHSVVRFEPDRIEIHVDGVEEETWMTYADAWDASWSAAVDGAPAPVVRSDSAAKAVRLLPGSRRIELTCSSGARRAIHLAASVQAAAWLVLLLAWTLRALLVREGRTP